MTELSPHYVDKHGIKQPVDHMQKYECRKCSGNVTFQYLYDWLQHELCHKMRAKAKRMRKAISVQGEAECLAKQRRSDMTANTL